MAATEIDIKIKKLGFELYSNNGAIGTCIYRNWNEDHEIELQRDPLMIYSRTISTDKDYLGHKYNSPMGLTFEEASVFLAKLKELYNN